MRHVVGSRCAANRAPSTNYSEVTGITQTARNFGASLGLAVLGAILVSRNHVNVTHALTKAGVPESVTHRVAGSLSAGVGGGSAHGLPHAVVHQVQLVYGTRPRPCSISWPG